MSQIFYLCLSYPFMKSRQIRLHLDTFVFQNYMRVVEVWLDPEFREYFYTREPTIRGYPVGNITDQLEFKKTHQVHSFKWFMDNIAYEVWEKFPPPPPNQGWGEVSYINPCQKS